MSSRPITDPFILLALAALVVCVDGAASQDALRGRLQLATYNIHHGTGNDDCTPPPPSVPPQTQCGFNLQRVADTIRSLDSDVVALQEVERFWARSGNTDQPALLAEMLGMHVCYGANLDHQPDTHSTVPHQYGTAILSRHPIAACANTLLPRPSGTEQRGLLEARISAEGTVILVYNTHLHTTVAARSKQTAAIVERIGTPVEPVVLMGDFNAQPQASEMAPIRAVFDDVWPAGGDGGPGYTFRADVDIDPDRRIDYVFVSRRNVEVLSARVRVDEETRRTADHYPVAASVRFR